MIGIVGGVGPLAGLNMASKIVEEVKAKTDQEHIPFILSSQPNRIVDRTDFLLGKMEINPAFAIAEIILELDRTGATVVAIPCNTAHAPRILDVVRDQLKIAQSSIKLLHIVEETVSFIKEHYGNIPVGVLSTTGTKSEGLYRNVLIRQGLVPLEPTDSLQREVHAAIYDNEFGIKANAVVVSEKARQIILSAIQTLVSEGAKVVVLGCTELPIAIPENEINGVPLVDPNRVMARALIREVTINN